jgi:hypothetical protein
MNAHRSAGALGQAPGERHCRTCGREVGAHADHDEAGYPGLTRAVEDLIGASGKVLRIEVTMRIDEHEGP